MTYKPGQGVREIILINEEPVSAVGAFGWKACTQKWSKYPRFLLEVTAIAGVGSNPSAIIRLEHTIDTAKFATPPKLGEFNIAGNGTYELYVEALTTWFPFTLIRANVTNLVDIGSFTALLVGVGDAN